jgi:hypothetical protein
MELPLRTPLQIGKATISKLTFREFTTGADYLSFDQRGGVAQAQALIASLAGVDIELVQRLRGIDYRRAQAYADKLIADDDAALAKETEPEKKSQES